MTDYTDIINEIIALNKEGFKLADDEAIQRIQQLIDEAYERGATDQDKKWEKGMQKSLKEAHE